MKISRVERSLLRCSRLESRARSALRNASGLLLLVLLLQPQSASAAEATPALVAAKHPPGTAIASAHALATEAGFEAIRAGGNAFDAAVAVSAALSVVEPISSGLGGGGFFLLHDARNQRDVFVDARETAPIAATPEAYLDGDGELDRDLATNGPWAAGIPGLPAGLDHIASRYGCLPLATSLAPAIRLAREGFPVYARLERGYARRREVMERYPGTRAVFLADGDPPTEGEILRQPDLARTLERLAEHGVDGFYRGDVADKLRAGVAAEGGRWTAEELAGYRVREREPLRFGYHDWEIVTAPPPSSGGVAVLQILAFLAHQDMPALGPRRPGHGAVQALDAAHLLGQAGRLAFADRNRYVADPDQVQVPTAGLIAKDYAAARRAEIDPQRAKSYGPGKPAGAPPGSRAAGEDANPLGSTTSLSVIDNAGNAVALTCTIEQSFGSAVTAPRTGVLLNNELTDFSDPGTANEPAPGKTPRSSMSPTIVVRDGRPVLAIGGAGGVRIIEGVLLGIVNVVDFGQELATALDAER
ncbi:MAG: gamma-glutamyltransferase, partial [Proteobacteria bacterium]|nr:gamma-glutamyltransferase [Pseudomonadota bacterium]